jgi:hypothetical protein
MSTVKHPSNSPVAALASLLLKPAMAAEITSEVCVCKDFTTKAPCLYTLKTETQTSLYNGIFSPTFTASFDAAALPWSLELLSVHVLHDLE